jgi:Ras-related protein Rab-1A
MVVGDSLSGKNSILLRFTDDEFCANPNSTNELNFKIKIFQVGSENLKIQFWDFDEKMQKVMTSSYFQQAQAILVVYSVYVHKTLEDLKVWVEQLNNCKCRPHTVKLLVGHKFHTQDSDPPRLITYDDARNLAKREGFHGYFEVEAKTGENVEDMFTEMVNFQRRLVNPQKAINSEKEASEIEEYSELPGSSQGCHCLVQ